MPAINFHFTQLLVPASQQNSLRDEIRLKAFDIATERGFISRDKYIPMNGVSFRLIHPRTIKAKTFDTKAKDFSDEVWERHWATDAVLDFNAEMAFVIGSRSGIKVLADYFSSEFDTPVEFVSADVDVVACLEALQEAYETLEVKKINVSEFVSPEKLVSRGAFKVLKNSDHNRFIEKWKDGVTACSVVAPDGGSKVKVSLNSKASLSISDNAPIGMIEIIKQIIFDNILIQTIETEPEPDLPKPPAIQVPVSMEV
jgi:hypothetical protein